MRNRGNTKRISGQSLIESVLGLLVMVIVVLTMIDLYYLVLSKVQLDDLAKRAARAAADHDGYGGDITSATAAMNVIQSYAGSKSAVLSQVGLNTAFGTNGIQYPNLSRPANAPKTYADHVAVSVIGTVTFPVPVPGVGTSYGLQAQFTEPWIRANAFRPAP